MCSKQIIFKIKSLSEYVLKEHLVSNQFWNILNFAQTLKLIFCFLCGHVCLSDSLLDLVILAYFIIIVIILNFCFNAECMKFGFNYISANFFSNFLNIYLLVVWRREAVIIYCNLLAGRNSGDSLCCSMFTCASLETWQEILQIIHDLIGGLFCHWLP